MRCECGSRLNIHNEDGICNECITDNKLVAVRFVKSNVILECWSQQEYLECIEECKADGMPYEVFEYKARARRVVNIIRQVRDYKNGEYLDLDVLMRDMVEVFLIDVAGIIDEKSGFYTKNT